MSQSLIRPLMRMAALLAILLAPIFAASAQGQYALLTHDGATRIFSGTNALVDANEAAVDGDIITLSAGTFNEVTLKNSITIRGYGNALSGEGTKVSRIHASPKDNAIITIEGIVINSDFDLGNTRDRLYKVSFNKCYITDFYHYFDEYSKIFVTISESVLNNHLPKCPSTATNCIIRNIADNNFGYTTVANSIIESPSLFYQNGFTNCIFTNFRGDANIVNQNLSNCIFILNSGISEVVGFTNKILEKSPTSKVFPSGTPIFKEGEGFYELTDDNAANWLGNDGTQVGIHGGVLPFSPKSTTPQLILHKVDEKTSPNGSLNVELGIEL